MMSRETLHKTSMLVSAVSPIPNPPPYNPASSPEETDNHRYGRQAHMRTWVSTSKATNGIRHLYKRRIIFSSTLIILPMTSFTITVIYVVFANSISQTNSTCPVPELCPGVDSMNKTAKTNFYIDFSPGRLAFISSLSSTISFALISVMMTIYAYFTASLLLKCSEDGEQRANGNLPSPYQTSVLLRVLNADLLVLMEVGWNKIKETFWSKERKINLESRKSFVSLVQRSVLTLGSCLLARYVNPLTSWTSINIDIASLSKQPTPTSTSVWHLCHLCLSNPQASSNISTAES